MHSFGFITSKQIREALENDYREMVSSAENGNAKCALVMAGSIMEALLLDYLAHNPNPMRKVKTDPLRMSLADAIDVCLNERVLTKQTGELCTVVRSFRNLIHPGVMIRLDEQTPDEDSAKIAVSLVNRIVKELAAEMRVRAGLTAEQVVAKIEGDPDAVRFLGHHLSDLQEPQRRRLLLEVLPERLRENIERRDREPDADHDQTVADLKSTYRGALEQGAKETKEAVAAEFIRVARQGDGASVQRYINYLFRGRDLEFVPAKDRPFAVALILDAVGPAHLTLRTLEFTEGICPYLAATDVSNWLDPHLKGMFAGNVTPPVLRGIRMQITNCGVNTTTAFDYAVDARLDFWDTLLRGGAHGEGKRRAALAAVREEIFRI
jgi:hypothetical protein